MNQESVCNILNTVTLFTINVLLTFKWFCFFLINITITIQLQFLLTFHPSVKQSVPDLFLNVHVTWITSCHGLRRWDELKHIVKCIPQHILLYRPKYPWVQCLVVGEHAPLPYYPRIITIDWFLPLGHSSWWHSSWDFANKAEMLCIPAFTFKLSIGGAHAADISICYLPFEQEWWPDGCAWFLGLVEWWTASFAVPAQQLHFR